MELLGRGSVSINTGGEKVHPEEVEGVLHGHPVGGRRPRRRRARRALGDRGHRRRAARHRHRPRPLDELVAHCKQHLSGYKAPKHLVLVDAVVRSPAGKADYRWARGHGRRGGQRVLTTACQG